MNKEELGYTLDKEFHSVLDRRNKPSPTSRTCKLLFGDTVQLENPTFRPSVFIKSLYKEVKELGAAINSEHTNLEHGKNLSENVRHEIADCIWKLMVTAVGLGSEDVNAIRWESKLLESTYVDSSPMCNVLELGQDVLRLSLLAWCSEPQKAESVIEKSLEKLGKIPAHFKITPEDLRKEIEEQHRHSHDPARARNLHVPETDETKWSLSSFRPFQTCFLFNNVRCKKLPILQNPQEVFAGYQFESKYYKTENLKLMIEEVFKEQGRKVYFPDDHHGNTHISCDVCAHILSCCLGIFEITDSNPNVMMELGLAYGACKHCVLVHKNGVDTPNIPVNLSGIERIEYDSEVDIREKLRRFLSGLNLPTWGGYEPPKRRTIEILMSDKPGSLGIVCTKLGEIGVNINTVTTRQSVPGEDARGIFSVEIPSHVDLSDIRSELLTKLDDIIIDVQGTDTDK